MLIKTRSPTGIKAVERSRLSKIALDGPHSLLDEMGNLVLIPLHGLLIGEIKHSIFIRHSSHSIAHMHIIVDQLLEITVLRREIRQLPEAGVEPLLLEFFQHGHRIGEPVVGKLIVALPVDAEPSCIEMNHISGYAVLPQFGSNVESFLL